MAVTYDSIASTVLGSNQTSVTFSSLGSYTDLVLVTNVGNTNGANTDIRLQFNGSTTGYSSTIVRGNGTSATSGRETSKVSMFVGWSDNSINSNTIIQLQNYSNSSTYKTVISRTNNVATSYVGANVGLWQNTAAITSITILCDIGSFLANSTFTLHGIKAA